MPTAAGGEWEDVRVRGVGLAADVPAKQQPRSQGSLMRGYAGQKLHYQDDELFRWLAMDCDIGTAFRRVTQVNFSAGDPSVS